MSPGILLIKTVPPTVRREGGDNDRVREEEERKTEREREYSKNEEQQNPDSEISLRETGHIERINRETWGKCNGELRGSNLVNTVA